MARMKIHTVVSNVSTCQQVSHPSSSWPNIFFCIKGEISPPLRRVSHQSHFPLFLSTRGFDVPSLKESFHSELSDSIFDEGALPGSYDGDIIADCWFPDNILPVVPNTESLIALMGPDGQPLYDSSTKQWDPRYLPPVLQKATPGRHRLAPGQEKELSTFMVAIMDALMRHHDRDDEHSPRFYIQDFGPH